jgi:tetratricopeptide (TPR) repeat protein
MGSQWLTDFTEESLEEIRGHLAALLADRRFASAERNAGFLRCVVEKSLTGKAHEIKETVIAMEVYDRSSDYDPKADSIVRVEASRLRQKLRSYYENEGKDSAIRIHLPSGSYIPRFERAVEVVEQPEAGAPVTVLNARSPRTASPYMARLAIACFLAAVSAALLLPLARGSWPAKDAAPEALQAWREGISLMQQDPHSARTELGPPKTLTRAIERLEYAVARSPHFAPAWATLAEACDYEAGFVAPNPQAVMARAETAARTAVRLDDRLAAGHHMLALQLKNVRWNFQEAEASYRRAIALDPNNAYAVAEFADLLWQTGRIEEAETVVRDARWRMPHLAVLAAKYAEIQLALGRADAAIAAAASALEMQRDYLRASVTMAAAHERKGERQLARAIYERVLEADPRERRALPAYGCLLARAGEAGAARDVAARLETLNETVRNCAFQIAVVYAGLGENERALDWLERAWRTRQAHFPFIAAEQRFRELRGHRRFQQLLDHAGLKLVTP